MTSEHAEQLAFAEAAGNEPVETAAAAPSTTASAASATPETAGEDIVRGPLIRDITEEDFAEALELSKHVPIVLDMWAPWCGPCRQLGPVLEKTTKEFGGKIALGKVNVDENPSLSQAFQVQGIPAVFLLMGGHPAPLFTGAIPAATVKNVFEKILELAAKEGVTGRLVDDAAADGAGGASGVDGTDGASGTGAGAAKSALPEGLAEAAELAENGDFSGAVAAYESYLKENPGESATVDPLLAKARLGARVEKDGPMAGAEAVERGNKAPTTDVEAQLAAADAQLNSGDAPGALTRLLAVVAETAGEDRDKARARMVEYFAILGDDPIVAPMRGRLATLLY